MQKTAAPFLTVTAITEMCNNFDEVIKGKSIREFLSDFNNLIESAVTLTLESARSLDLIGLQVRGSAKSPFDGACG